MTGPLTDTVLVHQASSGTASWDAYARLGTGARPRLQAHVARRGYRITLGEDMIDRGDHARGSLAVVGTGAAWRALVVDFWERFPGSLRARPDGVLEIGLLPDEFGPPAFDFSLRAGEHVTHEVVLVAPGAGSMHRVGEPLAAVAPAAWYTASGALGHVVVGGGADWPDHFAYLHAQLDPAPAYQRWMDWYPSLPRALESTDFYGVTDHGDWPVDYEGLGVSPFNLKYDAGLGVWLQWLRGGDARWRELAVAGNRHLAARDVLHTLHEPRHWSDGIAFGHFYHDEAGLVNPHRNEGGTHTDTSFGTAGLLLTWYLTGYDPAFDAAIEIADAIEHRLRNDDHLCDRLSPCSGEGYALSDTLRNDGSRPAATSLLAAVEAYRATGEARFLEVAEALVAWASADDLPYLDGLPVEPGYVKPWMLGLYLRSLAAYLDMQAEYGRVDPSGGRATYLALAGWLRTRALIDLPPIDTGPRAAFPYQ